ncbi:MAG: YtxH domain-containing protein [Sphingobacteriales bacterium]|nr:MAG: YtxH domain-containing protein [Sphingobacteriales bacterium]
MKLTKFTAGLSLGVLIGVFFAPAQGRRSRTTVANAAGKINATLKKWFGNKEKELEELKALLADESVMLTDSDRKRLMQLIENNQKALKELDI